MQKRFTNYFNQSYIFYLSIIILNFPKINLFSIPGISQGIRIDDILIALICFFNINTISLSLRNLYIFLYITFVYIFSFIHQGDSQFINYINIHYLKFLEYFFFYIILLKKLDRDLIIKIVTFTFIFQVMLSFIIFFSTGVNNSTLTIKELRATGTTSGPWELTMMLGVLYFIIVDYYKNHKQFNFLAYFTLWVVIFLAASRIVALSILSVFVYNRFKLLILLIPVIIIIFFLLDYFLSFLGLFVPELNQLKYLRIDTSINFLQDYGTIIVNNWLKGDFYLGEGGRFFDKTTDIYDPSLVGRLQQWGRYLDIINNSGFKFFAILFGSGPGSGGIINDGMYIKLFVDFGIVGFLIYLFIIIKTFINRSDLRLLIIFISISCITIDFYWPSKIAYSLIMAFCYFNKKNLKIEN